MNLAPGGNFFQNLEFDGAHSHAAGRYTLVDYTVRLTSKTRPRATGRVSLMNRRRAKCGAGIA